MFIIPCGLLDARLYAQPSASTPGFAQNQTARSEIELTAMETVMTAERDLSNSPEDVPARKIAYDLASYDPGGRSHRSIEVKRRADSADTVLTRRQEIIAPLRESARFLLAFVEVSNGFGGKPPHARRALNEQESPFDQDAIQFSLRRLLDRAEVPR